MVYDESLAARMRELLERRGDIEEKNSGHRTSSLLSNSLAVTDCPPPYDVVYSTLLNATVTEKPIPGKTPLENRVVKRNPQLVAMIVVFVLPLVLRAADEQYPRGELLLEPAELAKPEVARRLVILDVRDQKAYDEAHVPGALRVDHDQWKVAVGDGRDAEGWSRRIGRLGIDGQSRVVLYDDSAMKNAARVWWLLTYWGVKDARLLNGGWKTWSAMNLPTSSTATPMPEPATFDAEPITGRLATKEHILELLGSKSLQIVDSRSFDEFCGAEAGRNKRGGAIPGAKHLEWSDLIDPKTDRFKNAAEIRGLLDKAGIDLTRPSATHCQSGGRASVMVFGLELMGAKDVRNYYEGWSEWGNADDTPVEPGVKKETSGPKK